MSGERDQQPVDYRAERDHVAHHTRLAANFRKAQGQRPLKQNDSHTQRDYGEQQFTEQLIGIDPASDWTSDDADGQ